MRYSYSQILVTLLVNIVVISSMRAMEPVKKDPEALSIVNMTGQSVYMRIRSGAKDTPNIQVIRPQDPSLEYTIPDNDETFTLPKDGIFTLHLNQVPYPLRVRVWSTDYEPTVDVDKEGKPVETSPANRKNTKFAIMPDKGWFYAKRPAIALYVLPERTQEGHMWGFKRLTAEELASLEGAGYQSYGSLIATSYIAAESEEQPEGPIEQRAGSPSPNKRKRPEERIKDLG